MRIVALCTLGAAVLAADPVPDDKAKEAIARFQDAFKAATVEGKQSAVYDLHDVPNDLVLKELSKLLKNKEPKVRHVAALAVGGQSHDPKGAGELLLRTYKGDFDTEEVVASVLQAIGELKYMGYWPEVETALKDKRTPVVLRTLDLVGNNQDWRAFPELVEMYRIALPAGKTWGGGEEVTVDTGAEGDADAQAAEAQYNAQNPGGSGRGGGGGGGGSSRSSMLRNLSRPIERCVKQITGQRFDNSLDLETWWAENYITVARKIAELEGKDPESVVARAKAEQAELKAKVEADRKKVEEAAAKKREEEEKKK